MLLLVVLAGAAYWWWSGSAGQNGASVASGTIEATEVKVAAEVTGRVLSVSAAEGDAVRAGQELVIFDPTLLKAQRRQAEANAAVAKAQLDLLVAGSRPQEVRSQEEAVTAAAARVDLARAQLAQASGALQAAEAARSLAAARLAQVKDGARVEVIEQALVAYQQAAAAVRLAQADYDRVAWRSDVGATPQGLALERATLALQAASANYEALLKGATTPELDQARAVVDQALAGIIQASAVVSQTEASLSGAQAALRAENLRLDLVRGGARPEQVRAGEAQLAAAQAAVGVLDEQLARMSVRAPSDGTVLSRAIEPGEVALPGGSLLVLADLRRLAVTVYLPEDRYGTVLVGQGVRVTVDSYPGRVFAGAVQRVADRGEFTPRNVQTQAGRRTVVFAVKVTVDNPGGELKPGMPADVSFAK